jgi:hypothetical protein
MNDEESTASLISSIREFVEISDYLDDEDVDDALSAVVKLIGKPNQPAAVAAPLIVKLQALSSKFALQAKVYMVYEIGKSREDRSKIKNTLMTLSAELEKLSSALKYLVRV